jgi:hypothetical protein
MSLEPQTAVLIHVSAHAAAKTVVQPPFQSAECLRVVASRCVGDKLVPQSPTN